MELNTISLSELLLNQKGIIEDIKCDENIKRRLLDMGLVKGTTIVPVLTSPSKDPRAFQVRGTIIAIRKEDADKIIIKLISWQMLYLEVKYNRIKGEIYAK